MNLRKISSLTALVSFSLLMVSSIVLYIVPAGRVAYWADWHLWALNKENWGAVHTNLGFLLLLTILLHIFYNWNAMISYLKNRQKEMRVFTPDFLVSIAVTLLVFFGTLGGLPPFSTVLDLSASIKDDANKFYGEPPYGHAELSPIASFADKVKIDLNDGLSKLELAGIKVTDKKQTLKQIAADNHISPSQVYRVMKPANTQSAQEMPEEPPGGTGHQTLADTCETFQLDPAVIITGLKKKNLQAEMGKTIKENAVANNLGPHDFYAAIREVSLQ